MSYVEWHIACGMSSGTLRVVCQMAHCVSYVEWHIACSVSSVALLVVYRVLHCLSSVRCKTPRWCQVPHCLSCVRFHIGCRVLGVALFVVCFVLLCLFVERRFPLEKALGNKRIKESAMKHYCSKFRIHLFTVPIPVSLSARVLALYSGS